MMKGILGVCYHKGEGVQHTKELIKINTDTPEKSVHFEFKYNNRTFILNVYSDIFELAEMEIDGEQKHIFSWDEEDDTFSDGLER